VRGTRRKLALAAAVTTLAGFPAAAHAAEAVADGGFEGDGSSWTAQGDSVAYCVAVTCPGEMPFAGTGWLGLGGGTNGGAFENHVGQAVETVTITAPATLSLMLRIQPGDAITRQFVVWIDGTAVKTVTGADEAAYASYAPLSVDLSPYPGTHTLKLYYQSITNAPGQHHARYQVDSVSIQVPDPPPEPEPTPTPTPEPTPTPTPEPQPTIPTCHGKPATKVGTGDSELIEGSPKADVIVAGDGDDVIRTGAGDDIVCGGAGNDEIKGASGNDRLYGEEGRDKLNGGGGSRDKCVGGPSRDKATRSCEKQKTL
jgi:hypothetical protein